MIDLRELLVSTFRKSEIPADISDLKMGDLEEWDSLGNFNLVLAIEEHFGDPPDIDEMESLTSVSEMRRQIEMMLFPKLKFVRI